MSQTELLMFSSKLCSRYNLPHHSCSLIHSSDCSSQKPRVTFDVSFSYICPHMVHQKSCWLLLQYTESQQLSPSLLQPAETVKPPSFPTWIIIWASHVVSLLLPLTPTVYSLRSCWSKSFKIDSGYLTPLIKIFQQPLISLMTWSSSQLKSHHFLLSSLPTPS